jgi:hypothetical protein
MIGSSSDQLRRGQEFLNGCACCLARHLLCALKKKSNHSSPTPSVNSLKQIIVALTVGLEVKTQIEKRLAQSAFGAEKQCNQQAARSTLAIEEGMGMSPASTSAVIQAQLPEDAHIGFFDLTSEAGPL